MAFEVRFTPAADADVGDISDMSTRAVVLRRAYALDAEPLKQGKALGNELKSYRSVRAAGQRYRIVYRVALSGEVGTVVIVVIGIRKEGDKKDAYVIASKRLD